MLNRGGRSRSRRLPLMPSRTVAAGPTCGARVTALPVSAGDASGPVRDRGMLRPQPPRGGRRWRRWTPRRAWWRWPASCIRTWMCGWVCYPACPSQRQPAADPNEDQVEQAKGHRRSSSPTAVFDASPQVTATADFWHPTPGVTLRSARAPIRCTVEISRSARVSVIFRCRSCTSATSMGSISARRWLRRCDGASTAVRAATRRRPSARRSEHLAGQPDGAHPPSGGGGTGAPGVSCDCLDR
jgi:hypothetical protein